MVRWLFTKFAAVYKASTMTKGVWYMILATFFFASMNACVKLLAHIPAVEIVFFRSLISFVLSFTMLRATGVNLWGKNKKLLIARGAAGAVALLLYFNMLQSIPMASAYVILFLAPIFANIIGVFMVGEKLYPLQWVFFLMSFAGIILIKGFDTRIPLIYLFYGIAASIASGFAHNCIRKLKTNEHPVVIIFYFPLVTTPFTGVISAFQWEMPVGYEWLILLAIGVLTQIAQYFMTKSYQMEELSKVSGIRYLGIIYAITYGYAFFEESFDWIIYLGMAVVLCGVVLNIWYKHKMVKKELEALREPAGFE